MLVIIPLTKKDKYHFFKKSLRAAWTQSGLKSLNEKGKENKHVAEHTHPRY